MQPFHTPDYDNSIVNLVASIAAHGGLDTGHAPLDALPPASLVGRPMVLLVVDGLGYEQLSRHPESRLARHLRGRLTSVFPTTTATAITTFGTGAAPQQHGITGWFTWFRELGSVAAVLPFRARGGGGCYTQQGIEPSSLVGADSLYGRLAVPSRVLSPRAIVDSAYSRFIAGPAERHGHTGLADLFDRLAALVWTGPGYTYAYWSEVDALAHRFGAGSAEARDHIEEFDAAFEAFVNAIAGSGARVVVTADHGLIDTEPARVVHLERHPRLADMLVLPLCGEPRAAFCYVRAGREKAFRAYVEGELGDAAELHASADLIEEGWFGPGTPDPRLAARVGDYTLLMRDNWVIRDRLLSERPFAQIGVHGGTSAAEIYVPLIVVEAD